MHPFRITRRGIPVAAGLFASIVLLGATSALAGVEGREHRQRHRIHSGVSDGSLTRPEAHRLAHEQRRIERGERRLRANDGVLGPRERRHLNRRQNRASRHIYRARHNDRTKGE